LRSIAGCSANCRPPREHRQDAAGIAEALTPALAAVGLHRALHRGVRAVLDRASSATSASEELRSRFRSVSAELYFASGDLDLCRHLLDSVDVSPTSNDNLRWRAQLTAATWAADIDPAAVLSIVASHVLDGGSHLFAAEITLDLAARLIRDNRHEDATEVLAAAGGYAAVVDNDLLIARLHVTNAVLHSQTGDLRTGRQRLGAAYPIAAARGEYTFVHVVSACTGVDRVSDNSDGGAHLTEVAELLAGTALDVDHRSVVAVAVADHGPGWVGRRSGRTSPLLASVQSLYGSAISTPVHDVHPAAPQATTAVALTDREDQVANLVAEGLSNTDIGAKLGISRWTVVSHLRNIMRKWECSSRVEVALKYRS
jgi:DNA-binding CsgD family transcriptional regulator